MTPFSASCARRGGAEPLRAALAVEAFRHAAAYDARIAAELPRRMAAERRPARRARAARRRRPLPGRRCRSPFEKVETLRYGENPHQPAARYRRPGTPAAAGPFATGASPIQGKALCYNNVLDASAAAATRARAARAGRGHRQAHEPVRRRGTRDAVSTPGRVRSPATRCRRSAASSPLTRTVDRAVAEALTSLFLEVVVAPGSTTDALAVLATKPNLRLAYIESRPPRSDTVPPCRTRRARCGRPGRWSAPPDATADDPVGAGRWSRRDRRRRPPSCDDLELAWRWSRQSSRTRSFSFATAGRSASDPARRAASMQRARPSRRPVRSSDPTASRRRRRVRCVLPVSRWSRGAPGGRCEAFVQPGGSVRDADVIAAAGCRRRRDAVHGHPPLSPLI